MKRTESVLAFIFAALSIIFLPLQAIAGGATSYQLGNTTVTLNLVSNGAGKTYFAPHEDESTSLAVAKAVVKSHGGRVFWLSHGGGRYISFKIGGKNYKFDPNRMFTDAGAKASLKTLGAYSDEAFHEVRAFAEAVLAKVNSGGGLVVGMHNNTNGNYSVSEYLKNGKPAGEAREVSLAEGTDPDDFFFTNSERIFSVLKGRGFNVVLQKLHPTNDGSLSVRSPLPYVNIEAQHGHSSMQKKMLEAMLAL